MKLHGFEQIIFLEFVRAGLWEKEIRISQYREVDYNIIIRLAEEQSVVGLITAGLEHVIDTSVPKEIVLQFVGQCIQLEQQNTAMNIFIGVIVEKLRRSGVYTLLVKGQGVAQCYARPLWRSCGDVDFLLSNEDYVKAKHYLIPIASSVDREDKSVKHQGMTIDSWVVELHGSLHSGLSKRIDKVLDEVQFDIFYGGNVRSWMNGNYQVFLPGVNEDVFFVFTHILQHFFKGGIGLRQICDWCRLIFTYRDALDKRLLECRLRKAGLMSEWRAFAALAVNWLGMAAEAMPFYSPSLKWKRKADKILSLVVETGNFGNNRNKSYIKSQPQIVRKIITFYWQTWDSFRFLFIFPLDSLLVWWRTLINGILTLGVDKRTKA